MYNLKQKNQRDQNKTSYKKRTDLLLPQAGSERWRNWIKVVRRYKLPIIRQISSGNIMYSMITILNTDEK